MPMLAERRKKTKWMNPGRQALWNRDSGDTKFGREMMEKMGWKVGQGLGANEQGIKEPLKISFKNDNKGMGFKENDNEWIQQQSEFDELLSKLSSEKKELSKESQTNTVQSLEERSRLSKARVHYHKFTRGKDLAKYSKKDLECILGRNEKESSAIPNNMGSCNDNVQTEDKSLVTAGSMVDYFAEKIQSKIKKKKDSLNVVNPEISESLLRSNSKDEFEESVVNATMELDEKKKKKSKRKKEKDKDKSDCNEGSCNEIDFNNFVSDCKMKSISEGYKKSKKTKIAQADDKSNPLDGSRDCENIIIKNKLIEIPEEERSLCNTNLEGNEVPGEKLKKKKKKKKKEENLVEEFDTENVEALNVLKNDNTEWKETGEKVNALTSAEALKKKKKRSKRNHEVIVDEGHDAGELKEKIKKKKKNLEAENFSNEKDCLTKEYDLNSVSNTETNFKKSKEKCKTISERAFEDKQGVAKKDEREEPAGEDSLLYKGELLKKEYSLKGTNRNKLLNLIYCTNIEQFSGSNLGGLSGYGIVSYR